MMNLGRDLLGQDVHGALGVSRRQQGEAAGVDDAQTVHANDPGVLVDDGHGVVRLAHAAGAAGVPDGHDGAADVLEDLGVRLDLGAGEVLLVVGQDGPHGVGGKGLAEALEGGDGDGDVGRVGEPAGVDEGQVRGVGGREGDGAPGQGGDEAAEDGGVLEAVPGLGEEQVGEVADVARGGEVLDLGPVGGELGVEHGGGLGGEEVAGRLLPAEEVADRVRQGALLAEGVGGGELGGGVDEVVGQAGERLDPDAPRGAEEDVVLHVAADPGPLGDDGDLELVELLPGADAGHHEELGALEGAGGQDDLLAGLEGVGGEAEVGRDDDARGILDAAAAAAAAVAAVKENLLGEGELVDLEVLAADGLGEEGRLAGLALLGGGLDGVGAVLGAHQVAAVEVAGRRDADLVEGGLEVRAERLGVVGVRDVEGAPRGGEGVEVVLGAGVGEAGGAGRRELDALLEVRQKGVPGVAVVADGVRPLLVVQVWGFVNSPSTKTLAAGVVNAAVVGTGLALGDKVPVHQRVGVERAGAGEQSVAGGRVADDGVGDLIKRAGLDDGDGDIAPGAQPVGQDEPGGAAADNDVVKGRVLSDISGAGAELALVLGMLAGFVVGIRGGVGEAQGRGKQGGEDVGDAHRERYSQ
ncbi:hypothetical protein CTA1_2371 [Colletotrichum tanaceti]|uniref:Uncharacterized protein n=1 Tax=Colletotrichum tanaceti TaxID=1306861 RepID=A0A4U6XCH4_9PEZI|nr:hypothetical protein CTA1_2371 [Colletotrichum tanaceti]